jgi:hypothetical protein
MSVLHSSARDWLVRALLVLGAALLLAVGHLVGAFA